MIKVIKEWHYNIIFKGDKETHFWCKVSCLFIYFLTPPFKKSPNDQIIIISYQKTKQHCLGGALPSLEWVVQC